MPSCIQCRKDNGICDQEDRHGHLQYHQPRETAGKDQHEEAFAEGLQPSGIQIR